MNKNTKNILLGVSIGFFGAFIILFGLYTDAAKNNNDPLGVANVSLGQPKDVDFSLFWKVWETIDQKYVDGNNVGTSTSTTTKDRVYGAIRGLIDSLGDPYSVFFNPVENEDFTTELSGSLEGVGMEVGVKDGIITVISPIKGSPADKSGIKPADKIVKINDKETRGLSVNEAVKFIRGKKGTEVKITVVREGASEPLVFPVIRDVIAIPTVDTIKMENEGVFVIKVYNFSANAPDLFRKALREFVFSGYTKLIVDLRNNPGGFLDGSVDMASWFIGRGKIIVSENFGGKRDPVDHRSRGYDVFNDKLKMVILVNGGSASASEIFAGALSEYGVAKLVGSKTFGKGSVQEVVSLPDGSSIKITIAKWLTPKGVSISANGLVPQFEIKPTEDDLKKGNDVEMKKALEVLGQI